VTQQAKAALVRTKQTPSLDIEGLNPRGRFVVVHYRNGKRINEYQFPNGICNEGKNKLLDVMFHGATAIGSWFLGLIDNTGYTALAATDTYANIGVSNGWAEFTGYTDGNNTDNATTRPEWQENAAANQSITNGTVAIFNVTSAGTIKGVFLVGGVAQANLKSDHAAGGCLWATALFSSGDVAVQNGDQLKVTYTVSA
jgi:hypothetical protein